MEIKLQNMEPGRVFNVDGPRVEFVLDDDGQANVTITLSVADGTHFHYPDASGSGTVQSTLLPPGDYQCVIVVSAFDLGTFGRTYKSKVSIAGKTVATAKGSVPQGQDVDQAFKLFVLHVN